MAATYKDYYKLLGVDRKASKETIAHAFKKLARENHPDLNPNDKHAEERFKEINEAYEVLKDPEKRKLYDQLGPNWKQGQAFNFNGEPGFEGTHFTFNGRAFDGTGFSEFFDTLFGGGRFQQNPFGPDPTRGFSQRTRKGRDIEAELLLSLEDVQRGGMQNVTVATPKGPKQLQLKIPVGIQQGKKLRLSGQGENVLGGTPGDLFLKVKYRPHARFQVQGQDLLLDLPLTPWEAALGCRVNVETLDGTIELVIPAGTSSGKKFKLRQRGLGDQSRGDLLVQAMIRVPATLSSEEKRLWEELAKKSAFQAR